MILFIDTSNWNKARIALVDKELSCVKEGMLDIAHSDSFKFLEIIKSFIKSHGFDMAEIKGIVVNGGPGSYTGTRVGVALSSGLAMGLGISVGSIKSSEVPEDLLLLELPKADELPEVFYNTTGL